MTNALMPTYARLPLSFTHGDGACLWDEDKKQYLDAVSGIAVCSLGHAHPEIASAVCDQMQTLVHTSNLYQIGLQAQLGEKLCQLSGLDKVFFSNSGAEANEAAIKLARLYGHQHSIKNPEIIVMNGSFHGRTMATLSATGNRKVRAGFDPLVEGFVRVDYDDIKAIELIAEKRPNVVAILVEPIQGEGGVNTPDDAYLRRLREICDRKDWLLMLDEIQTGMCRTGKWFAFQHDNITPDVMTLAKALGNGVPIGACLAAGKAASVLQAGNHGSTFGGNPLACRAALTVTSIMERDDLATRAHACGQRMRTHFAEAFSEEPAVKSIRGKGLILGIELDRPCGALVQKALAQHLLINVTANNIVRLLPPLIITDKQLEQITTTIIQLIRDFLKA